MEAARQYANLSTLPLPDLCLSAFPNALTQGPKLQNQRPHPHRPTSPRYKACGCSFTQAVGQQSRGARTPTGTGSTAGVSHPLLLRTALGSRHSYLALDYQGLGQVPQMRVHATVNNIKTAHYRGGLWHSIHLELEIMIT